MDDHEERALQRALSRYERGPGKRYPRALHRRVATWARREIAGGRGAKGLAWKLGLSPATLTAWLEDEAGTDTLVAVEVIAEPAKPEPPTMRTLSVVSPSGYRIEGLTLDEAAALLARLR